MIQLTKNGFESSYDIGNMLYNDMIWLTKQVKKPYAEFEKIAKEIDLTQDNWNMFWKKIREYRSEVRDIECIVSGRSKMVSEEEFEVVKQILFSPEVVSNCCSADILGDDICSDCKEHCGKVYIF